MLIYYSHIHRPNVNLILIASLKNYMLEPPSDFKNVFTIIVTLPQGYVVDYNFSR